ncbi:MAG: transcriptional regulator [Phaeodactylibacter sp.]|nr:transcriptional regulator [Phaeodactylibacter sp.]MCB9294858.1 transcriptional regulator [Lewinellaceae bacterium]
MKEILTKLNPAFDHRVRLGIMSILMVNDWVEFNTLKETLDLTDGRLASHIKALEKERFIEVRKRFVGKKPNTSYRATAQGQKAFKDHLDALERLLDNARE